MHEIRLQKSRGNGESYFVHEIVMQMSLSESDCMHEIRLQKIRVNGGSYFAHEIVM
jgi:hypothetical protein